LIIDNQTLTTEKEGLQSEVSDLTDEIGNCNTANTTLESEKSDL
jgi:hypothetical protein